MSNESGPDETAPHRIEFDDTHSQQSVTLTTPHEPCEPHDQGEE